MHKLDSGVLLYLANSDDTQRPVNVLLSRRDDSGTDISLVVSLTPRKDWGGRGLLGCHLLPL